MVAKCSRKKEEKLRAEREAEADKLRKKAEQKREGRERSTSNSRRTAVAKTKRRISYFFYKI